MKPDNFLRRSIDKATSPLQAFLQMEASSGIFLLFSAICALVFANLPSMQAFYFGLIHTPIEFSIGGYELKKPLLLLVNDGLMAVFFFVVGLEIKRELLVGELSSARKASFSFFAAIGGMVIPAGIFLILNAGTPTSGGWGIPMATDIAFALGIVTLLGNRVPVALKIFLLALAIVDDLGAIAVIALFYSGEIATSYLALAFGFLTTLFILNHAGFRNLGIGLTLGLATWFCFLKSGIHATIAGVLLAFLTPAWMVGPHGRLIKSDEPLLDKYIHDLHPWVAFFIMPVFAFFNAGVAFTGVPLSEVLASPLSLGIIFGLLLGKPLGVLLFTYIPTRLGWTELPQGASWGQITAIGFIAGIGFTMSLFIGSLAFPTGSDEVAAKVGILVASFIAMLIGYISLLLSTRTKAEPIVMREHARNAS